MNSKQKWIEAVTKLIASYQNCVNENTCYIGSMACCALCDTAHPDKDDNTSCPRCIQKMPGEKREHPKSLIACADMITYPNTLTPRHDADHVSRMDLTRIRLEFWKRALVLLESLPENRFWDSMIKNKKTPFPELWALDQEVYEEFTREEPSNG